MSRRRLARRDPLNPLQAGPGPERPERPKGDVAGHGVAHQLMQSAQKQGQLTRMQAAIARLGGVQELNCWPDRKALLALPVVSCAAHACKTCKIGALLLLADRWASIPWVGRSLLLAPSHLFNCNLSIFHNACKVKKKKKKLNTLLRVNTRDDNLSIMIEAGGGEGYIALSLVFAGRHTDHPNLRQR
jgi:hypothetical protein